MNRYQNMMVVQSIISFSLGPGVPKYSATINAGMRKVRSCGRSSLPPAPATISSARLAAIGTMMLGTSSRRMAIRMFEVSWVYLGVFCMPRKKFSPPVISRMRGP